MASGVKLKRRDSGSTQDRFLQARIRMFSKGIANPAPWELVGEGLQNEIKEVVGSEYNENPAAYRAALSVFRKTTGGLPKDKESRMEILRLIAPLLKGPAANIGASLNDFMVAFQFINLAENYKKGNINAKLQAILNDKYEWTDALRKYYSPGRDLLLSWLIDEKKIDFAPLKGEEDYLDDWYFDYRIRFSPLPGGTDDPPLTLERVAETAERNYVTALSNVKDAATRYLNGVKASEELLKNVKDIKVDQDGYIRRPVDPEVFLQFAEAVEKQYMRRQKERTRKDYAALFNSPYDVGFYVNPVTCTIYDLRPYTKDLHDLFSIKSWRYLKDFVAAIRETVTEFEGAEQEKKTREKTPPPSIFEKAFIKMFNAVPTNNIVNINTSKSGRRDTETGYFEQNVFTQEWEYKKGGTEVNIPIKYEEGNAMLPLFSTSTWKTMHFLSLLFSAQNSTKQPDHVYPVIETNVREYMIATKRKITVNSVKDTTKVLKKDLDMLAKISLKYNDKKYSLSRVNPFAETHMDRGKIKVVLAPTFAEFLVKTTGLLMNYPAALLALRENNSNIFPLGFKLALNRSNDANIRSGKANILSVPVCLEWCPGIPSIDRVRKEGKGYSPQARIIEPFEKAMNALKEQGVLESWKYCLPKGGAMPVEEVANADKVEDVEIVPTDYDYFASLYILYEIKDFPIKEELPRIKATAEKRKKRKERVERFTDQQIARIKAKKATE